MQTTLIRNGRVVTAADDTFADVYIRGERIAAIGTDLPMDADVELDATGCLVLPGGVDCHTHMELPMSDTVVSSDTFATGTLAAAFGGTTTIVDFPTQDRGRSTLEAVDTWHAKAEGQCAVDYAFHCIVTDMPDARLGELQQLVDQGITSFKLFQAYPDRLFVDDATLYRAFRRAGEIGARICMHAENGIVIDEIVRAAVRDGKLGPRWHARTRPTRMEAEGVHRAIAIAEVAEVPLYIVHLSSAEALEEVKRARCRGQEVTAETCPQYLLLDDSRYDLPGFEGAKYVMTPPLRAARHREALWDGLRMGFLSTVATDHCPFCFADQKILGKDDFTKIPNGAPGVENRVPLLYHFGVANGPLSLNQWVELVSTAPARTFGLYPRKGTLAAGSDADVVIFDPAVQVTISAHDPRTHHMNVDYTLYEGFEVQGQVRTVLRRGQVVVRDGRAEQVQGGQFVPRAQVGALLR